VTRDHDPPDLSKLTLLPTATWDDLFSWVGKLNNVTPEEREEWLSWGISPRDLDMYEVRAKMLVEDLVPVDQNALVIAAPGGGKSTLAWTIAAQASQGSQVFGHFACPEPLRVMIVDFEQSVGDVKILRNTVEAWGLDTSRIVWLTAIGRPLDVKENMAWLQERVEKHRPQLLVLDTATDAVRKPKDDESVRPMFDALALLKTRTGVAATLLLAHPRKRPSGTYEERVFDDLFGSVLWQTRTSASFFLEEDRVTVWKQRGGHLRRRWGKPVGQEFVIGEYVRSDDAAPTMGPLGEAAVERREAAILAVVEAEPDRWSQTSLVEDRLKVSGPRRAPFVDAVKRMVADGNLVVGPGPYKRLSLPVEEE
jgi:AAA domain-containing protein